MKFSGREIAEAVRADSVLYESLLECAHAMHDKFIAERCSVRRSPRSSSAFIFSSREALEAARTAVVKELRLHKKQKCVDDMDDSDDSVPSSSSYEKTIQATRAENALLIRKWALSVRGP